MQSKHLTFITSEIATIVTHAKNAQTYSQNAAPKLLLVYDESGIYLRSNALPFNPYLKAYARYGHTDDEGYTEFILNQFGDNPFIKELPLIENISDLLKEKQVKIILLFEDTGIKIIPHVDFDAFFQEHEASIRENCEPNTISKDDDEDDDNWDELYKKLKKEHENAND